jgi:hypothetical protein
MSLAPSLPVLRQLHRLDRSSSGFHDQLSDVLDGEEYKQCVPDLQGDDLVFFVDYLDDVRRRIALPCSPLKPAQALGNFGPTSSNFQKCLRELKHICGTRMILPTSYTLPSHLLDICRHPVVSGGSGDVYEGTLNGSKVCVKRVREYSKDGLEKTAKVHYHQQHCIFLLFHFNQSYFRKSGEQVKNPDLSKPCP